MLVIVRTKVCTKEKFERVEFGSASEIYWLLHRSYSIKNNIQLNKKVYITMRSLIKCHIVLVLKLVNSVVKLFYECNGRMDYILKRIWFFYFNHNPVKCPMFTKYLYEYMYNNFYIFAYCIAYIRFIIFDVKELLSNICKF